MSLRRLPPPVADAEVPSTASSLANTIWTAVRNANVSFDMSDLSAACGTVQLWAAMARAAQSPETLVEMRAMLESFAAQNGTS